MAEATLFRELLAHRVRARRRELRLTQDEVARRAWANGSAWMTRGAVGAIERGTADLDLPQLAILVRVLETDLSTLVGSRAKVFLDKGVTIEVDDLVSQVFGRPTDWDFRSDGSGRVARVRHGSVVGYVRVIGVAEQKAASKLGVSPEEVADAAGSLWGRSLAEERDARLGTLAPEGASARTIQALRGHITRKLLQELEPALKRETPTKRRSRGKP